MNNRLKIARTATVGLLAASVLAACGSDDGEDAATVDSSDTDESLVIYVGRDEELVSPLVEQFVEDTGIEVETRYADTPELAALLIQEGAQTPADIFLSQDAGALGALSAEGLLEELPAAITDAVYPELTSTDGTWVGVTGRARVFVYDGEELSEDEVPGTVASFTEPQWSGRVGFPPANAGFQAFITGYRVTEGDDAARAWLDGMVANDFQEYERNGPTLDAVNEGSLDIALVNHYYWYQRAAEQGEENMRAQLKFADPGDPGGLINVTGAAALSDNPAALTFIEYLISTEGQEFFVNETYEYPLVPGIAAPEGLPELETYEGPEIDLSDLADLEATVQMIQDAGLL